ncbi:MAG: DJ-1/PfpI family protein [Tannerella sp.]|jgi:4-methyl-5(b-hydroxyethyl)-thiazole monophosphate biosynthesis|nr:DJ-1/PfpI family protein [Tannerella sp.]
MKAYLFLATGFEEIEAIATIDILRRGGVDVKTVSITGNHTVSGVHQIPVWADYLFEEADFSDGDTFILPGGGPGSFMLNDDERLKQLLVEKNEQNKWIAAICAAPLVLGGLGLLKGKKAICYPGMESYIEGAILTHSPVVTDGNIITGMGPGQAFNFGLAILAKMQGQEAADKVARDLLL